MAEVDIITAAIAPAGTVSTEADIGNKVVVGLQLPAAWVTAAITFQATIDGGASFGTVIDAVTGTAYTIPSVAGAVQSYVAVDPTKLRGISSLKIVSGASQTAGVTISLVTRLVH
jgi:hypothetical protein